MGLNVTGRRAMRDNENVSNLALDIPSVKELHTARDSEGLEVSGWLATWDEDSAAEAFISSAFDKALPQYLALNPVVLHNHRKDDPPCGRVVSAHIDKKRGLYGTVLLPKPEIGTKAMEVYSAVRAGLLKSFSVGGLWRRINVGGKVHLICERLVEVSLAGTPTNQFAVADGVASVRDVKSLGGVWVPADQFAGLKAANEGLARAELRFDLAANLLRARR
jgi:HK97 family phage prohead protease